MLSSYSKSWEFNKFEGTVNQTVPSFLYLYSDFQDTKRTQFYGLTNRNFYEFYLYSI